MSDEEIQPCVSCHILHQQMLMLACIHDPCISCAAKHFCQSDPNSKVYQCTKCGETTELDSSSVAELIRIYTLHNASNTNKHLIQKRKGHNSRQSSNWTNKSIPSSKGVDNYAFNNYPTQAKNTQPHINPATMSFTQQNPYQNQMMGKQRSVPIICPQHSDEELTYYCFTCKKPICPECAIHGSHRDHEVQAARKAVKTIKESLFILNERVSQQISQDNNKRQGLKKNIKDLSEKTSHEKRQIQQQFNKLRGLLAEKQKEFYRCIESNYDQNSLNIKGSISSLDKNIDYFVNTKKSIENLVKKQDLTILAEFAQKQTQIKAILEQSSRKKSERQEQKIADMQQFNHQIQQLTYSIKSIMLTNK